MRGLLPPQKPWSSTKDYCVGDGAFAVIQSTLVAPGFGATEGGRMSAQNPLRFLIPILQRAGRNTVSPGRPCWCSSGGRSRLGQAAYFKGGPVLLNLKELFPRAKFAQQFRTTSDLCCSFWVESSHRACSTKSILAGAPPLSLPVLERQGGRNVLRAHVRAVLFGANVRRLERRGGPGRASLC